MSRHQLAVVVAITIVAVASVAAAVRGHRVVGRAAAVVHRSVALQAAAERARAFERAARVELVVARRRNAQVIEATVAASAQLTGALIRSEAVLDQVAARRGRTITVAYVRGGAR